MNDYLVSLLSDVSDPQGLDSLFTAAALLLSFLHRYIVICRSLQAGVLVAFNFKVWVSQNNGVKGGRVCKGARDQEIRKLYLEEKDIVFEEEQGAIHWLDTYLRFLALSEVPAD